MSKAVKNICIEEKFILRSTLSPDHKTSMSSKPEPAIWSYDTGLQIPCFYRCQLTIAWIFNIKDTLQTKAARLGIRDFKMWYGEAVVRRQIVKITSGDVMTRVPLRLSRRGLAFYCGKVPSFTYSSLREYKPAVYSSF